MFDMEQNIENFSLGIYDKLFQLNEKDELKTLGIFPFSFLLNINKPIG